MNCPNCGAPEDLRVDRCPYCGTPYPREKGINDAVLYAILYANDKQVITEPPKIPTKTTR